MALDLRERRQVPANHLHAPAPLPVHRNGPALGIHAKSAVRGTVHDDGQRRRWALQRHAAGILADKIAAEREGDQGAYVRFRFRVAMCHRGLATGNDVVTINRNADGTRAEFRGVQTCGSVWHCPVCAPKIAATRREEMNLAIAWAIQCLPDQTGKGVTGNGIYMLNLTRQHDADGSGMGQLGETLGRFSEALSKAKGSKAWRAALGKVKAPEPGRRCLGYGRLSGAGAVGSIRALEVTYGELNGWHPHTHEILFADRGGLVHDRTGRVIEWLSPLYRLRRIWARELLKRGMGGLQPGDIGADRFGKLRALLRRCLTVQPGSYAADYVAKFGKEPEQGWGLASELTRSHMKTARTDHASPWQLLSDSLNGDKRSGELFREYATVFHRRRQLFWSPGLKALCDIEEREDDELAAAPDKQCSLFVAHVSDTDWKMVLRFNARFELLKTAAIDGPEGVALYLATLREAEGAGPPGRWSDHFTVRPGERWAA